ncbi:ElaB/YqjD/DUF883 family membrane-anchored ribosome-binding protein [Rhodopirellula rubra]|uniref:ElaB/YqjD/DUF883 family membrane-anchored ribosome-binding protein n=1 Tax=Aporhodopirellula rubra TaxID=980271 RepID=A0A7W5H4C7_9BACT|nr:hypothetical protein [Aporhodopirellula rubra]MBB3204696.1 ElaB/YqjD/DUF883 family membrane-anchored ribosome-binding protein [Aporhodopirellula rubra]
MSQSINPTTPHAETVSDQARETASRAAAHASEVAQDAARHFVREPAQDLFSLAKQYARENPDVAACWAFGLGVVVGWKLKP